MKRFFPAASIAAIAFLASACASFAQDTPDYSKPPKSVREQLGDPPGPIGLEGGLRWVAPQGGESFLRGGSYPLVWTGGVSGGKVAFSLIRMDEWTVVPGAPQGEFDNDGIETWKIPVSLAPGEYEMYVAGVGYADWRYSGTFVIEGCACPAE